MDDKIQNKWDQFKSKEDEYLKMNEQIEERRKNIQSKLNQKQPELKEEEVDIDDADYNQEHYGGGEEEQEGDYDEFGLQENEYNNEQEQEEGGYEDEDKPKEFSNRDYINKIIQRVNKEDENETHNYKQNKKQKKPQRSDYDEDDEEAKQADGNEEEDDDDIDAETLLKRQEQLEEKLNKYKKIDSKKNEELLELEMLVEEQEKIIRVQRIRKEGLLGEIESLQDTLRVKENILGQLGEKGKSFEEETESYQVQVNLLNEKIEETKKLTTQFAQQKLQEEKECKALQNEVDSLKKDTKKKGVELNKKDIKLQEEVDKIKMNLQVNKGATSSDKQGDAKKINEKLQSDIKKMDRQIQELLTGFKKQLRLIDILKRQKNHLIAGQIFAYTEEQFVNAIEMGQKI